MRWLAAIAAFVLCTLEGQRRRRVLKERVELLSELLLMLNDFSIGIRCRASTLDELIRAENGRFARLVTAKLQDGADLHSAWDMACDAIPKAPERALLLELGQSLGTSDKSGQLQIIEMYSARISDLREEAEGCYKKKGGALSKVGMLCGAAAAILIL